MPLAEQGDDKGRDLDVLGPLLWPIPINGESVVEAIDTAAELARSKAYEKAADEALTYLLRSKQLAGGLIEFFANPSKLGSNDVYEPPPRDAIDPNRVGPDGTPLPPAEVREPDRFQLRDP